MSVLSAMLGLVDREMAFWGKPVFSLLAGALPIVAADPFFEGPPAEMPLSVLVPTLAICVAWAAVVIWRYMKFEIKKFRDLQALAAEEEAVKTHG